MFLKSIIIICFIFSFSCNVIWFNFLSKTNWFKTLRGQLLAFHKHFPVRSTLLTSESCPDLGPFAFLCLCVWVWGFFVPPLPYLCVLVLSIGILTAVIIGKWYLLIRTHPIPPGKSGNSGILGIVLRNVFAVRQNHFHGLGNYWEVIFPQGKLVYQCITMQKL